MGWLGLDDTDTVDEGCTTFSLHALIEALPNDVKVGTLRLVRLWPYAQQRTRGNAAVAVELSPSNEAEFLLFLDRYWREHLQPLKGNISPVEDGNRAQSATDPGMVWFSDRTKNSTFYFDAVRNHISLGAIPEATKSWGGMGRIGATAAVLWPQDKMTWEAVCWRKKERWSTSERSVCDEALAKADHLPGTFLTRDPRTERSLISPRGTCPVLFGVRSRTKDTAKEAARLLTSAEATEPSIAWRVFCTNQATDDHLDHALHAKVQSIEVLSRGTTVIQTNAGKWLAFAESGDVKHLAQSLCPGDEIEGMGLNPEQGVLHLERLRLHTPAPTKERPMCIACNRRMKSMGKGQGVRCPTCKNRQNEAWIEGKTRMSSPWTQPPMDARRHLAKPLDWNKEPNKSRNG